MVQVFPVPTPRTVPDAQVPPVMEKVPPAVPTLAIVGDAVSLTGPALAPVAVLVTVMVPVLVVVLAVVVVNTGAGALKATVPLTTRKLMMGAPIAVVTVTT